MPRKTKKKPRDKDAESGKTGKNEMGHGEIKINQIGTWKTRMGHGSRSGPKWNAEYKKWVVEVKVGQSGMRNTRNGSWKTILQKTGMSGRHQWSGCEARKRNWEVVGILEDHRGMT